MNFKKLFAIAVVASTLIWGCNSNDSDVLAKKRKEYNELEKEVAKLSKKMLKLEGEIADLDTQAKANAIPIRVTEINPIAFENSFELQAIVESDNNVLITPEVPARVNRILVREGQKVSRGQVLAILDGSMAQAQIAELENAMLLSKENYDRLKNLWDQNIGSEMQYLQAKNQYENLQKSLQTAKVQLSKYTLRSPISGQVDEINVKVGELAGTMTGGAIMRVVNISNLKLKANVSERYSSVLRVGQKVTVNYPSLGLSGEEEITAVGKVIDINNRTFSIYTSANNHKAVLKPNMLAMVSANDFVENEAISIPTKLIRNDGSRDYVFAARKQGEKITAYRAYIEVNRKFASQSLISSGLEPGTLIISEGYGSVIEGDEVKIITD
jgi:RND family efflux transporter MFP subunit